MIPHTLRGFAVGNALVAAILLAFDQTIPMRYWALDVPLRATSLLLLVSVVVAVARPRWGETALRIAAIALLVFGVGFVTMTLLTLAFLTGIHGLFLRHCAESLLLVLGVCIPYFFAYPWVLLTRLRGQDGPA